MLRKLLFITSILIYEYGIVFAQPKPLLNDAAIVLTPTSSTDYFTGTFEITLNDTINIDQLEFSLGTDADSSDLVSVTIGFDNALSLPTGFAYSRNGFHVSLTTHDFRKHSTYFGSVKAKTLSGTFENPRKFVAN